MEDHGPRRQAELYGHRAEQDLHDEQPHRNVGGSVGRELLPAPCSLSQPPRVRRERRHQPTHGRRRQPVPILDHRREVEWREQLALSEGAGVPPRPPPTRGFGGGGRGGGAGGGRRPRPRGAPETGGPWGGEIRGGWG